jgi:glyoxylase-like metal-dependent hydrolase (beta-lactamase superfamily II)
MVSVRLCLVLFFTSLLTMAAHAGDIWENVPYEPADVEMHLIQVSPHAYYVQGVAGEATENQGFMSNAGVVITEQGVVVIDALGTPSLAYLLLTKIREVTDKPIVKVIATHYHADHIYGLQVFKDQGAEIIAPLGAKDYLMSPAAEGRLTQRRESLFPWVDARTHLVKPDVYVSGDTQFRLGGLDFKITLLGSTHSQGDLILNVVQDNVTFAGDLIFEGRIPFVAGAKPQHWIDTLAAMDTTKLKVIVPGHGAASTNPTTAVNFTLGYLRYLQTHMREAVENLMPFDDAYSSMDWSRYEKMPAAKVNRMNAYYMYLELEAASVSE